MLQGRCRRISLSIHGRSYRRRISDQVARVFAVPDRPRRIVASEALEGGRGQDGFSSTRRDASAEPRPSVPAATDSPLMSSQGEPIIRGHARRVATGRRAAAGVGDGACRTDFQKTGPTPGTRSRHGGVEDDVFTPSRACFLVASGWSREGGAHALRAGACRQAKQGSRSTVRIRLSGGQDVRSARPVTGRGHPRPTRRVTSNTSQTAKVELTSAAVTAGC